MVSHIHGIDAPSCEMPKNMQTVCRVLFEPSILWNKRWASEAKELADFLEKKWPRSVLPWNSSMLVARWSMASAQRWSWPWMQIASKGRRLQGDRLLLCKGLPKSSIIKKKRPSANSLSSCWLHVARENRQGSLVAEEELLSSHVGRFAVHRWWQGWSQCHVRRVVLLLSYFILKGCALSRDDQILLASKNAHVRVGWRRSRAGTSHFIPWYAWAWERSWLETGGSQGTRAICNSPQLCSADSDENYDDGDDAYYQEDQGDAWKPRRWRGLHCWRKWFDWRRIRCWSFMVHDEVFDALCSNVQGEAVVSGMLDKKLRDIHTQSRFHSSPDVWQVTVRSRLNRRRSIPDALLCHRVGHWAGDSVCPPGKSGPQRGSKAQEQGSW